MDISGITSAQGIDFNDPTIAKATTGKSTLDVNDFLKLLSTQLTYQDPMQPTDDTQFISQMASFTSLQQMQNLSSTMTSFASEQSVNTAQSYIGKTVTVTNSKGTTSGVVTAVSVQNGAPQLTIGGNSYDLSDITAIAGSSTQTSNP